MWVKSAIQGALGSGKGQKLFGNKERRYQGKQIELMAK